MGEIHVHEFMSADGVIDAPVWTFDYEFDPRMRRGDRRLRGALDGHPCWGARR